MAPKLTAHEVIGIKAAGGIVPHHGASMHLLPVGVLGSAPSYFIIDFKLSYSPGVVVIRLVALGLSEVVSVGGVSLNAPVSRVLIRNSIAFLDVLEIFAVLGINEICQVLSFPYVVRELIDLVIEGKRTSVGGPLVLHGAVGHVLEKVVIA